MKRFGVLVLVVLLAVSAGTAVHYQRQAKISSERLAESMRQVEQLRRLLDSSRIPEPEWEQIGKALKTAEPESLLRSSLLARQDLIPWKGVLGGTMAIPGPDSIWFFAPAWALAYVEDGHIAGYLLFRFRISGNRVTWTLVDQEPL